MTMIRILGDIHGRFSQYKFDVESAAFKHGITETIQLGDFGIGFYGPYWHDQVDAFHRANPGSRFIRGNHDNPARCKEMVGYIPDGTVEDRDGITYFYVGGAFSIDSALRTEGVDWWRDEELNYSEWQNVIDTYAMTKPQVVFSHDAPVMVVEEMKRRGLSMINNVDIGHSITQSGLQAMTETHAPKVHFFGHWHHTVTIKMNGTLYMCVGANDYIDFNLEETI